MSFDQWVSIFSAIISFAGFLAVAWQMRIAIKDRRLETLVKAIDGNRELLALGFSHPQLFGILSDAEDVDSELQQRYLQLWLNHLSLIHAYLKHGRFDPEFEESLERDIRYFMVLRNMQSHWGRFYGFYPPSFQKRVNAIIARLGSSETHPTTHDAST